MVVMERTGVALAVLMLLHGAIPARAVAPANTHFERSWARTHLPVTGGFVDRTWKWGPHALSDVLVEPYLDLALRNEQRIVQYFDKARTEITAPGGHPDADTGSILCVANGLVVVELISGRLQTGVSRIELADIGVAGAPALAHCNVTRAFYVIETNHDAASVFRSFMNVFGAAYTGGAFTDDLLFQNPFVATGYPLTEAYWTTVLVDGAPVEVLVQCFERRCLIYTPGDPEGWRVESGNVDRHYHEWRYGLAPSEALGLPETIGGHS
jgi:hypothetical protein